MAKTLYHANQVLQSLKDANPYLGFLTNAPTDDTTYPEVTGTGYARVQPTFSTPSGGIMQNSADTTVPGNLFNQTIRYVALFSASTGGHLLRYYAVSGDEWIVDTTSSLVIGAGNLVIKEK